MKKISTVFILIFSFVLLLSFNTNATGSGKLTGELSWNYKNGILTVSGTGNMENYSSAKDSPWYEYRKEIKQVVIEHGVRSIGMRSFYGCNSLVQVNMTDSIEAVYGAAFYNCTDLDKVVFEGTEYYWERIKVGKDNECFTSASLSYRTPDHIHKYKEYETVTKASMEKDGQKRAKCTVCSKVYVYQTIPKISKVSAKNSYFTYTSKSVNVSSVIIDSNLDRLVSGKDYKVTFSDKISVGKHKATVTFKGDYKGSYSFYYHILPADVTGLASTSKTDSITLKWNKVKGATGYRIYLYNSAKKKYDVLVKKTSTNTYTVKKLKKATNYTFLVKSYTKTANGYFYSKQGTKITTCTAVDKCKISKISQTTNSVTFTWNKVTGATGYRVYMYDKAKNSYKKLVTSSATKYVCKNLKPARSYTFAVKAYRKAGGNTVWGALTSFTTAAKPEKVTSLTAQSSVNQVKLSWKKASSVTGYRVYSYNSSSKKYESIKTLSANKITISSLKADRKYVFAVRAYVRVGDKVIWSDYLKITVRTEKDGPSTVFVAPSGTKYHKKGCPKSKNASEKVSVSSAIKRGYTACSYCK